ncbi:hypothetical protein Rvan_1334 [Rhodomicrobium vannielii ATCC 17100]|uniref:Uncharacterized protein n=1 Tax=Rhodomicrobium vannielii (strain ATCC 17100 / DSM 162 / LMG 4299 / NCIMB 10020 / ATH 3.1.1) TaxID=648757 RepID=E3I602_RHOVT|nr:hypothetical protein Rvan_1334 [Rhodomicrobium vannielii ATCC 17100]
MSSIFRDGVRHTAMFCKGASAGFAATPSFIAKVR